MIVTDDEIIVSVLKENGVTLSEKTKILVEKGAMIPYLAQMRNEKDFMRILSSLISEIGRKKPHISDIALREIERRFRACLVSLSTHLAGIFSVILRQFFLSVLPKA